jgi:hypothetical protein
MKGEKFLMAAVAGLTVGASAPMLAVAADKDEVKCYGVNSCGHHSMCAVKDDDLAAVRKLLGDQAYKDQFGKSETHACGSHAKCGASSKILNWTTMSAGDCHSKGGLVIEQAEGKKIAKKA